MNAIPSGTTHSRYNKQKRKTNYFSNQPDGDWLIWNKQWEPYSGSTDKMVLIGSETPLRTKKEKAKVKDTITPEKEYDSLIPTLAEEAMDYIPSPVLRKLIEHYKNADVVEVEINVKTTHVIKG